MWETHVLSLIESLDLFGFIRLTIYQDDIRAYILVVATMLISMTLQIAVGIAVNPPDGVLQGHEDISLALLLLVAWL